MEVPITPDQFFEGLRRIADGPERDFPFSLQKYGVNGFSVDRRADGSFTIELDGVRYPFRGGVQLEGRGRAIPAGEHTTIEFSLGVKPTSAWFFAGINVVGFAYLFHEIGWLAVALPVIMVSLTRAQNSIVGGRIYTGMLDVLQRASLMFRDAGG